MAEEFVNIVPAPYYSRISEAKINSDIEKKAGESMMKNTVYIVYKNT